MKTKKNWYVANCNGDLAGHDLSEAEAHKVFGIMQDTEPTMEWEAMESIDEDED